MSDIQIREARYSHAGTEMVGAAAWDAGLEGQRPVVLETAFSR